MFIKLKVFLLVLFVMSSIFLCSCGDLDLKLSNDKSAFTHNVDITYMPGQELAPSLDEYQSNDFPLVAHIPEKNIYLYADKISDSSILYVNGARLNFDWYPVLTPRAILPRIYLGDFSKNGRNEIAIILHTGSGTGVSLDELRIIEILDDNLYSKDMEDGHSYQLDSKYFLEHCYKDYTDNLYNEIKLDTYCKNNELITDIELSNVKYSISLREIQENYKNIDVNNIPILGSIVSFYVEGEKIKVDFGLGLSVNVDNSEHAIINYIGYVSGEVVYENGEFILEDLSFRPDNE